MHSAILLDIPSINAVVLDLPLSIQDAQGVDWKVVSTTPVDKPYPSTEPKGSKRDGVLSSFNKEDLVWHQAIQVHLTTAHKYATETIGKCHGHWCLSRCVETDGNIPGYHKNHHEGQSISSYSTWISRDFFLDPSESSVPFTVLSNEKTTEFASIEDIKNVIVENPHSTPRMLVFQNSTRYIIPANSHFLLSSLSKGTYSFDETHRICAQIARSVGPAAKFDLILMDPPWNNRSVQRAKTYSTAGTQAKDPFLQTLPILEKYLDPNGIVAVWITNSRTVRNRVVESLNLLRLYLSEEWIWLKITSEGEPVCELTAVRRRPYEVLLVFRRQQMTSSLRRLAILAVPDFHSRKPPLKQLFESRLHLPAPYMAMELFARSLTSGWWSWGDEVLKFQQCGQGLVLNRDSDV